MKILGLKEVPIAWLRKGDDIEERLSQPHVIELSKSMDSIGQLHEPLVRGRDALLITGRDRVAAHILRNEEHILVKLCECSDEVAEEASIVENVRRRSDPERNGRDLARLLELHERKLRKATPEELPDRPIPQEVKRARVKAEAREAVARVKDISAEGVRKAEYRAKLRAEKDAAKQKALEAQAQGLPVPAQAMPEIRIDDLGYEIDIAWADKVAKVRTLLQRALSQNRGAQAAVSQCLNEELPYPRAALQKLQAELREIGETIRRSVPMTLCHYCKGQPELQPGCTGCYTEGFNTEGQLGSIPEELRKRGPKGEANEMVFVSGLIVPMAEAIPSKEDPWAALG